MNVDAVRKGAAGDRARVFRLAGEVGDRARSFLLHAGANSIGSRPSNHIVLPVPGVSREHAVVTVTPGGVRVEDAGSKNGTFVDGRRVTAPTPVPPGARLAVGPVELAVEVVAPGDATVAIPGGWAPPRGPEEPPGPESATAHLPAFAPETFRRWLAALERSVALLEPGAPGSSSALAEVARELEADAVCLLELRSGRDRVLGAWGELEATELLSALRGAAHRAAAAGSGKARFEPAVAGRPGAIYLEEREEGALLALGLAGGFAAYPESEHLLRILVRVLGLGRSGRVPAPARSGAEAGSLRFPPGYVVGTAAPMRALYRQLASLGPSDDPVLLWGETGSGKEPLARILHASSRRSEGPFAAVNCAAIPAELLEAELFGVARGAATGVAERPGHFQRARGGTLLLDEIGDMSMPLQAKLLRVIENREVPRLGGGVERADVRIVAATHRDLEERVARGSFRADLYYRIATHVARVPPLRERREDVPALVEHFLAVATGAVERKILGLSAAALELLVAYPWPGNVRELENEVRRLVAGCPDGALIDSRALSEAIRAAARQDAVSFAGGPLDLKGHVAELEGRLVVEALRRSGGNQSAAARALGVSRNGLALKMRRLGIEPDAALRTD